MSRLDIAKTTRNTFEIHNDSQKIEKHRDKPTTFFFLRPHSATCTSCCIILKTSRISLQRSQSVLNNRKFAYGVIWRHYIAQKAFINFRCEAQNFVFTNVNTNELIHCARKCDSNLMLLFSVLLIKYSLGKNDNPKCGNCTGLYWN